MWSWFLPTAKSKPAERLCSRIVGRTRSYRSVTRRENGVTYKTVQSRGPIGMYFLGPYKSPQQKKQERHAAMVLLGLVIMLTVWLVVLLIVVLLAIIVVPIRRVLHHPEPSGFEAWLRSVLRALGRGMSMLSRQ